ncbi:hypothetical protein [Nocardia acidivorans]|uniref:hypothetical protein n=1 Tax=Nocardia acidivorans TaxID=404580 RepID=UPI000837577B|nr:hypothetical protein [Nocardia acidivorans]
MRMKQVAVASAVAAAALTVGSGSAGAAADPMLSRNEAMAEAYLDALVSHDASAVRFTPDATRVEAGLQTGYSGPQLSNDLEHGVQYRVVQRIREVHFTESGDVVTARYLLDSGVAGIRLMTVDITETFAMTDGAIHTIVATITPV